MDAFKDEKFDSFNDYQTWRQHNDKYEYSIWNSVSAAAANPNRRDDAQIKPSVKYYKVHLKCKARGGSKSKSHK